MNAPRSRLCLFDRLAAGLYISKKFGTAPGEAGKLIRHLFDTQVNLIGSNGEPIACTAALYAHRLHDNELWPDELCILAFCEQHHCHVLLHVAGEAKPTLFVNLTLFSACQTDDTKIPCYEIVLEKQESHGQTGAELRNHYRSLVTPGRPPDPLPQSFVRTSTRFVDAGTGASPASGAQPNVSQPPPVPGLEFPFSPHLESCYALNGGRFKHECMSLIKWVQESTRVVLSLDTNVFLHESWWAGGKGTYQAYDDNWRDVERKLAGTCTFFVPISVRSELESVKKDTRKPRDVQQRAADALKFICRQMRSTNWKFQKVREHSPFEILYPSNARAVDLRQVLKRRNVVW
jgi:hypothetical protein